MKIARFLTAAFLASTLCSLAAPAAQSATLEQIRQRGKLVVGVKRDMKLFGYQDAATGKIEGMDPDLAKRVADDLGVELELVPVWTAERIDALTSGRIDLLVATLSVTPEREKALALVRPHYYSAGTNVLARKTETFKDWNDLRNRRVCGRRGAFYNRVVTVTYGADVISLYSADWANAAVRENRCSALLYDDTAITAMLQEPAWSRDFVMPLKTILATPWAIALPPAERGGALEKRIARLVASWHRSGELLAIEKKWGIPPTPFLTRMNEVWNRKERGKWYCGEEPNAATPGDCL